MRGDMADDHKRSPRFETAAIHAGQTALAQEEFALFRKLKK